MEVDTKEVSIVKQQATKALTAAEALNITTQEDYESATDMLSKIKTVGKMISERKKAITAPLMESLNSVRDLFKPIEQSHANAERIIKDKMLDYQRKLDEDREKEKARIAARVEKGTMKAETAIKKVEEMAPVPTSAKGKVGQVVTRTIKRVRITDETKIPREYLMPNMALINEAVLKQGVEIPGVEMYEEKTIAAR
jgi:hypothetical protein